MNHLKQRKLQGKTSDLLQKYENKRIDGNEAEIDLLTLILMDLQEIEDILYE